MQQGFESVASAGRNFDKYEYYQRAVQSPECDAEFLAQTYWDIRKKEARILREDFCAGFALCCEWIKRHAENHAIGIDLDSEPLDYGRTHYLSLLSPKAQSRMNIIQGNVLDLGHPSADIICALNFSYMVIKSRIVLKEYLTACFRSLKDSGLIFLDCFGGADTQSPNEQETELEGFSYFWDQDTFNPLTNEAQFYIHFKRAGERKRKKVFSYDWRLWSLAELRDLMLEVGFKDTITYWEGTDEDGSGNGIFTPSVKGDDCDAWVAYIVGIK